MTIEYVLAIDGGGTHTRCALFDRNGRVLSRTSSGPSNHLLVGIDTARDCLAHATRDALRGTVIEPAAAFVSAGLAGIDYDGHGAADIRPLFESLGFREMLLNGDMVIGHAGALGAQDGVVALGGTGSVVLGIDPHGNRARVGGWGPLFGDEGSAFWIGRRALQAASHAIDGRGPRTALVEAIVDFWGLANFRDTFEHVYLQRIEPREIAGLAPIVVTAAASDGVARDILQQAGEELGAAVLAAINRLQFDARSVAVSWQGSLLESCAAVREAFAGPLQGSPAVVQLNAPIHSPIEGAFLLAAQSLGWDSTNLQCERH